MRNLSRQKFNELTQNSIVLAQDEFGEKVLELPDHSIIKLFRVKRFISQATLYSPARRFAKNAKRLQQLKIPTISLINLYKIKHIKRTAVHYRQLEGLTLREYLQSKPIEDDFLARLGEFLAHLHAKGIFFRSAHFGNIIVTPEKQFGLIDISDMSISHFALGYFKRIRNLKHIFRLPEDIQLVQNNSVIEQSYLAHCGINKKKFHQVFLQTCEKLKQS
ncbi:MAG: toluene tolerance protein [gamma proteobacterium symbiont of Bathyaustriella thionipta]|nr:toluene tolerance protein [gamma proteobacterium symbiont of Bathyaustriella thionipta]MCU7948669.1 toluene tolerance protein [gamma proteobacterium symbiont of Bathyaustriella thionipta]MCU7952625.1 toluene tolerance protein [gamma proteobacterium symbiont of Bathyaustriella thionipta]MCU7955122.1 toluene tolerance protein [gamma proteobacterium symbiont of Bathyaustriella thionipta]MCU7967180.1 toluene tolerance protein [gamma proteobacterium symbiont of Bathyaustriella thionipta]